MNRPLIRQVQQSILDETKPFDMTRWETCIAGHCFRTLKSQGKLKEHDLEYWGPMTYASREMGIPFQEARGLFSMVFGGTGKDRAKAVEHLEDLLRCDEATQKEKEASRLRGKTRSRSSRATRAIPLAISPEAAAASPYWHGLPPTVAMDLLEVGKAWEAMAATEQPTPADLAEIDAVLREAEEELQLV